LFYVKSQSFKTFALYQQYKTYYNYIFKRLIYESNCALEPLLYGVAIMNTVELLREIRDYRGIFQNAYDDFHTQMNKDIKVLQTIDVICGDKFEDGLRVRLYFNLSEDEVDLLNSENSERYSLQGEMFYYPSSGDWWEEASVHIQYHNQHSDEEIEKHEAMLRVLHKMFWLAGDLAQTKKYHPERSLNEYIKSRAIVDTPELWPHLSYLFRWLSDGGFPMWSSLDLLQSTYELVREEDKTRYGFVYLLEGTNGWHKIGRSKQPLTRIEKLGVVLPFPIEIKHLIETDDMFAAESRLHQIFSHRRGNGEWFQLTEDEIKLICSLNEIYFMPNKPSAAL
jgi:hypothetical protein